MKRAAWLFSGLFSVALMAVAPAFAQNRLLADFRLVEACSGDVVRLCLDVMPGEGRIKACMKDKMDKLSPDCVDAILSEMAAARETPETKPIPIPEQPAEKTFTGQRAVTYCEVWLMYYDTKDSQIAGVYFNTSDLNNSANKMDTCPASIWDKITVPKLEDQYDVLAAYKNGPRGWTFDTLRLPVGPVETFDGLETRWFGQAVLPKGVALTVAHLMPYQEVESHRKSEFTYEKGKPVFILEDPQGTPWVMQAFGQIIDKSLAYDTLKDLGAKLKPPTGWKFRVAVLDKDLTISTPQGYNWIVQDELQNTYDACKEGACNFKP
jgi:hypothetical protein